ncbi:sigma 54-interacting transcriptional regulator [Nannocystis sp.]|uniref:sigma 54-dependent Fis family transcriptional regulator n=1 Tax=Nannocystis sp. TaxID=1962667 RepID=UPI0025DB9747|nr:sigma 54-interacting transcriptional regulator [Nannocystis sp.]MBK7829066.1 sigma-54-dependent Fis family transcriptional regulator [Nannocystis sp.]
MAPEPRRAGPNADTLNDSFHVPGGGDDEASAVPVLVLLWSLDEPERCGEAVHLPQVGNELFTIGRAIEADDDDAVPLSFGQLRPAGRVDTGPLRSARVSRRQLAISHEADGALRIEQLGRGTLRLDGHAMPVGVVRPGGVIEVEHRLVLLYTRRPATWVSPRPPGSDDGFEFGAADPWGLVGEAPATWELRRQIFFLAAQGEHLLVLGPSGSGKELVVQAIHRESRRGAAPLVSRNAATIPEALIDAELFGNLRNYPNPGMPERPGLLGEAAGGSLFLDEIGELAPSLQAHLLRVMDRGEYQRLGETQIRHADLRLLAATNRDPGELKHDLLARFTHRLQVPGLGERPEDTILIARQILQGIAASTPRTSTPTLGPDLVIALVGYGFTTHVRELQELLWRALRNGDGDGGVLGPPPELVRVARPRPDAPEPTPALASLTRAVVLGVLERCAGVKEVAWRELGLRNRYQLHRVLKKLGIE